MRFSVAWAMMACLLLRGAAALAQYPGQAQPTLLPLPNAGMPSRGYAPGITPSRPATGGYLSAQPTPASGAFAPQPAQAPNNSFAPPPESYAAASAFSTNGRFAPATPSNLSASAGGFSGNGTAHIWDDEPPREEVSTPVPNNALLSSEPLADPASSVLGPCEGPAPPSTDPGFVLPCGVTVQPGLWFGSLAGLIMTRDHANPVNTTFNVNNPNATLLNTQQATGNWTGGGAGHVRSVVWPNGDNGPAGRVLAVGAVAEYGRSH